MASRDRRQRAPAATSRCRLQKAIIVCAWASDHERRIPGGEEETGRGESQLSAARRPASRLVVVMVVAVVVVSVLV
jgi:hypothetical protein